MARKGSWTGTLSRSRFWGHAAADMGDGRPPGTPCIGSVAELRAEAEKAVAAGVMKKQPAGGVPQARLLGGELQHLRPAPPLCGRHRPCIGQGRTHAARKRPHRRLVRQRRHALCPVHYPFEISREEFLKRFPADFIAEEGPDAGWFFTLQLWPPCSSIRSRFRNIISNGLVLDKTATNEQAARQRRRPVRHNG